MSFNCEMLTLARESNGLTQSALSHLSGVSQGLVSKVENGLEVPAPVLIQKFADACEVPVEFFEQQEKILGEGIVDFYHKKRLTLPMKPLKKANAIANTRRLELLRLLRTLEFEDIRPFPTRTAQGRGESSEEIADFVRSTWRVPAGPLRDLTALIEAAGVPVFYLNLGHEKLFAISMPGASGRHVIVINSMLPSSTRRFALAHELGHLVMHDDSLSENMEAEADEFAAALLMPALDIRPQLRDLKFRSLGGLKMRWRVSMAALIRRAYTLGQVSESQYRWLNIELNKLPGGRKAEPGEFEAETPRLIRHVIQHYIEQLGYSVDEVAKLMVVTPETLHQCYLDDFSDLREHKASRNLHSVPLPDQSIGRGS